MYPTASQSGWRAVVQKEVDSYLLHASSDAGAMRPAAGVTIGGSVPTIFSPSALPVGVWSHLAMTYDGPDLRLFLNGVQVSTSPRTGPITTSASPLWIGETVRTASTSTGASTRFACIGRRSARLEIQTDMVNPVTPGPNAPKLVITAPAEGSTSTGGDAQRLSTRRPAISPGSITSTSR